MRNSQNQNHGESLIHQSVLSMLISPGAIRRALELPVVCHVDRRGLAQKADMADAQQLTLAVSLCKFSINTPADGGPLSYVRLERSRVTSASRLGAVLG